MTVCYPTITASAGRRFFDGLEPAEWRSLVPSIDELPITWITPEPNFPAGATRFDTEPLYRLGRTAKLEIERNIFESAPNPGERFEAAYALRLHALLHELPGAILSDRAFWRFVSLGPLFAATVWRQREKSLATALGLPPASARRRSVEGFNLSRHLPWRLYMRAEIGLTEDVIRIEGADLWWSHVFRVHIGRSPVTARAFLSEVCEEPVTIQRAVARLVTADRGRKSYDGLDSNEVEEAVREQKNKVVTPTSAELSSQSELDPAFDDSEGETEGHQEAYR